MACIFSICIFFVVLLCHFVDANVFLVMLLWFCSLFLLFVLFFVFVICCDSPEILLSVVFIPLSYVR